jgi:very-short-patch-repair endonuclease
MDRKVATPDLVIAEIAARQHGVVSASQLRRSGIGEGAIRARLGAGRLHTVHRGVYAVGHAALSYESRCMAGVLAVGRGSGEAGSMLAHWGAAVSHRDAACLWGLLQPAASPLDVIVAGDGGRKQQAGIRVHRSRSLVATDVIMRRGIPVTTPARTIADLRRASAAGHRGALSPPELRRAIRQANVLGLPIGEEGGRDRTRSDLERNFLRLCRRHGLPPPDVNVRVGPYLVDFLWREQRLVVETDSFLYHRGRVAFQDDRRRDLALKRDRYEVLHICEQQLDEEAEQVVEAVKAILDPR